ncbi:hypothetical protein NEOLEDRAFT_1076561 [Neolentinus lepideus HHB14362 ss-1]|uniref:Uncharacterized protein n=1 Tax=Neolentinus lepideus HHB14362 ss-1 TaxID=1314782 RepID=A0A165NSZ2_9AGAM|nr:hypothetical protein NEOLEDRAFT_1076561 [Neolentinus lepideus HHB14362 ss-1]
MGALLYGVTGPNTTPIRPLHTSFRDYLMEQGQSEEFYMNGADHHKQLCYGSIKTMLKYLHFNIGDLVTSHRPNPEKIQGQLDNLSLSYSCCYWGYHLQEVPYEEDLSKCMGVWLKHKLLYWFEALSVLRKVNASRPALLKLEQWFQVSL